MDIADLSSSQIIYKRKPSVCYIDQFYRYLLTLKKAFSCKHFICKGIHRKKRVAPTQRSPTVCAFLVLSCWAISEVTRQQSFYTKYQVLFYVWRIKPSLKVCEILKAYEQDCNFSWDKNYHSVTRSIFYPECKMIVFPFAVLPCCNVLFCSCSLFILAYKTWFSMFCFCYTRNTKCSIIWLPTSLLYKISTRIKRGGHKGIKSCSLKTVELTVMKKLWVKLSFVIINIMAMWMMHIQTSFKI